MNTNKPMFEPVVLEIACDIMIPNIFQRVKIKQTNKQTKMYINVQVSNATFQSCIIIGL